MNNLQLKIDILRIKIKTLNKLRSDISFCFGFSQNNSLSIIDSCIKNYQNKLIKLLEKKSKIKF